MQVSGAPTYSGFGQPARHDEPNDARFGLYDEPEMWADFSLRLDKLSDSQVFQSFVTVKGMHCAACALTLEDAVRRVNGVLAVQVSAASARASITWSATQTKPSRWLGAGLVQGYQLLPADDAVSTEGDRQQSRLVLWRWMVALFCMMQVMMYAAPTYFTQPGDVSPDIERLLRWASWVLSLPVVLFSCKPFFSNAWRDLVRRRISMDLPVAMGIAVTFAVSTAATFEPQGWWGREVYFDSLTMFVFFLLTGRWLEQRLNSRTAGALGALMQRLPSSIQRQMSDGHFEQVAVRRLRVGDVVRVLPGDAFPADGSVLLGDVLADEALLTGESWPVVHPAGGSVIAGSYNVGQTALIRVDKLGVDTRYAQIVALMAGAALDKPQLAVMADRVAKPFLWWVLVAAAGAAAFWWRTDPAVALMAAAAVLVVTCPCALSLATPTAMLTTAGLLARHGVLVRRLQAIESLSSVDTVIFDKTGTLTDAAMSLERVQTRSDVSSDKALQWAASLARHSLHPVSRALVFAAAHLPALAESNVKESAGLGLEASSYSGSPAAEGWSGVLRLGSRSYCGLKGADKAVGRVHLADSQGWVATFDLAEALRPDALDAVAALQARGLAVHLLSGDTLAAATRVAGQLGIQYVEGDCLPQGKLAFMQALQAQGHKVLMVGDGLNDGPTLAAADVSVAVGAAVPLAQAQSDLVLPGAQLSMLPVMLGQSRRTLHIVKQNLAWAAIYNATCVPLAIGGFLPAWLAGLGMALSSLLVVANAARLSKFKTST